jgi:hypothetical protein
MNISSDIFQTHPTVGIDRSLVGRFVHAQRLGVDSVRVGRSRLWTRMRTTTMISIILASPSPGRVRPGFNSPVAGTGNRSCSAREEVGVFYGALLARAHRPMQARWRALRHQDASCGTAPPCAFVPSPATCQVEGFNVARSRASGSLVHHSRQKTYPPPARLTTVGLACSLVNNLRKKLVRSSSQNFYS